MENFWKLILNWETLSLLAGAFGLTAFIGYRAGKVRDALNEIIKAAEDSNITEAEFQAIVKAVKAIWAKKS